MTISIWRYSHLILAISSSLFILIATITGSILAFEPISNKLQPFAIANAEQLTLSKTIKTLQTEYDEIVSINVDSNHFVSAAVLSKSGKHETFYINPFTGKKIGHHTKKAPIFKFATNLHRSLFLKSTGRFIISFIALLLLIIASTGIILITKRQGGFKRFFSKVVKDNFEQYYHVIIGRLTIIPIVIITITGIYLSLETFSVLPSKKIVHNIDEMTFAKTPKIAITDFDVFKTTSLKDLKRIEFPFSDAIEDTFILELTDKELLVNQYTGQIISKKKKTALHLASSMSLVLHTGQGTISWSIILLLACFAILFFIYSGFTITLKRKQKRLIPKNKFNKDIAKYIILVGSETGSTFNFASTFYKALLKQGQSVFISELNKYTTYKNAKHLIIFTSTYGDGEAPTNAKKFGELVHKINPINELQYAVIGFGSLAYPGFCKYAIVVDSILQLHQKFVPNLSLFKINNQSFTAFKDWTKSWGINKGLQLQIENPIKKTKAKNTTLFKVVNKSTINTDASFLIELQPTKKTTFTSGDLLSVLPKKETVERLYSIARIDNNIVLSIKKHEFGICSNYFNQLKKNDMVTAAIKQNKTFQLPTHAKEAILISNGTGIAPFLGMINNTQGHVKTYLFWGGRTRNAFKMYTPLIDKAFYNKKLSGLYVSFSNEQNKKKYVQHLLMEKTDLICRILNRGGIIMICGSVAMQNGVLNTLEQITVSKLNQPLSVYLNNAQIKMDCY